MNYLFGPKGWSALEMWASNRPLFVFDFDGTLSPIVPNPKLAKLEQRTCELLKTLSNQAPVIVLSGRSVSDLKERIPLHLDAFVGNHGIEGFPGTDSILSKARKATLQWEELILQSGLLQEDPGLQLENKKYSLAFHYRHSRERSVRKKQILSLARKLKPAPHIIEGKCVVNLLPARLPTKGDAVQRLLEEFRTSSGLFVGDDDTDEDVFSRNDVRILSIRVGKKRSSKANYFIEGQREINRLLEILILLTSA